MARNTLRAEDKIDLMNRIKAGESHASLCQRFGISQSRLNYWRKKAQMHRSFKPKHKMRKPYIEIETTVPGSSPSVVSASNGMVVILIVREDNLKQVLEDIGYAYR